MISEFRGKSQFRLALLLEEADRKCVTFIATDWDLTVTCELLAPQLEACIAEVVNDLAREQAVAALSGPGVGVAISAALKWSTIVRLYHLTSSD